MPGTAVIGSNLVDSLLSVVDGLRSELYPAFGVRAFRVYTVRRTWSGRIPGEGTVTEVEAEITPQPLVAVWSGGLRRELEPCGIDEHGEIVLTEVSLTYTDAELTGGDLPKNVQWFWRLREAHGQATQLRDFLIHKPPYPDRIKDIGWVVWLRRA